MGYTPITPSPYSDETLTKFLFRRRKELLAQVSALRGQLEPREAELARIEKLIGESPIDDNVPSDSASTQIDGDDDSLIVTVPSKLLINGVVTQLTIKDMILRALTDHFGPAGATPSELRDYMRNAYGRDVDRNSISPQLARLRDEGLVQNTNALTGKWEIVPQGTIEGAAAEIERKNVNALTSANLTPSPRAKRWYGDTPKKD